MNTSQAGIDLIKNFEQLRLAAYRDAGGVPTIGYGSTRNVRMGMRINAALADARLRTDLGDAEATVNRLVTVPLSQPQFDALVSLTFNIGGGAFAKSTLLRRLNAGDYASAALEFGRWVKDGGRPLRGLVRRRAAEQALFTSPADA